jgi:DNA-directed RNA polymerase subunit H (RpoH/RPB5)
MSGNPLLLPINKDATTIRRTLLTNIIKMIAYRKWFIIKNSEELESQVSALMLTTNDDNIYKIKLHENLNTNEIYLKNNLNEINKSTFDGTQIVIKILQQKIIGINKIPTITDFISTYKNMHKILIVDSISDKAKQQLDNFSFTEVFNEAFHMINLVEHVSSPQYEILTQKEMEEFMAAYQVSKRKLSKMDDNDPASQYLYIKKGQIVRIIRDSEISGKSIAYRVVIHKGINKT